MIAVCFFGKGCNLSNINRIQKDIDALTKSSNDKMSPEKSFLLKIGLTEPYWIPKLDILVGESFLTGIGSRIGRYSIVKNTKS